jgi:hypothetical protein
MIKSPQFKHLAAGYLCLGCALSLYQNLFGELTAFAWTGSVKGNLLLLFWWFIVPVFIWPWDLFWGLFHRSF